MKNISKFFRCVILKKVFLAAKPKIFTIICMKFVKCKTQVCVNYIYIYIYSTIIILPQPEINVHF